jgi:hypothetical protein
MPCFYHKSNPSHFSLWSGESSNVDEIWVVKNNTLLPWGPILKHTQLQHKNIHFIFHCIFDNLCNRMILQIYIQQNFLRIHLNTASKAIMITSSEILIKCGTRICTSLPCKLTKNQLPNLIRAISYSRLHNMSCVKIMTPSHRQIKM